MKNNSAGLALITAFLMLSAGCLSDEPRGSISKGARINGSINKGIDYLYSNQMANGEFQTDSCTDDRMEKCVFDSSPFVTSFVLYSIKGSENKKVKEMSSRAIEFLLYEEGNGGVWKYWTKQNGKYIDPDVDDTATISFILKKNNESFTGNLQVLESNKNDEGLYLTWIRRPGEKNDLDCVVNANVLLYTGKNDPSVCSYINREIKANEPCSQYYPDRMVLYYVVSRAYENNITCFEESKKTLIQSVLALQKDGSFGSDMDDALALNTLLNLGYAGSALDSGAETLINDQRADGSWPRAEFYLGGSAYYGSDSLTTALAVEALEKYLLQGGGSAETK
jgi:hypothetical protein